MSGIRLYGQDIDIVFTTLNYQTKKYLSKFSCGNSEIDKYFCTYAFNDKDTVTHIFIDKQKDTPIALISISCSKINYVEYVYDDSHNKHLHYLSSTPAIEIKYFATAEQYHSLPYYKNSNSSYTLSRAIMSKSISYIHKISLENIGASKIILNSLPQAVNFYEACFFKRFEDNMDISEFSCYLDSCPMYFNLLPE